MIGRRRIVGPSFPFLVIPPPVGGGGVGLNAVGVQSYASSLVTSANNTGLTISAGSNIGLVVAVLFDAQNGTTAPSGVAVTWNGVAMTLVADGYPDGALGAYCQLWGLANPATGNRTIAVSWTTASRVFIVGIAFNGVNQAGGTTSFPNGVKGEGVATINVTSATGDKVVAACVSGLIISGGLGTSIFLDNSSGTYQAAYSEYDNGASSVTVGAGSALTNIVGVNVKAA